jgi:hypothetical protein
VGSGSSGRREGNPPLVVLAAAFGCRICPTFAPPSAWSPTILTHLARCFTASLTAFTGLAHTALLAGFAANICSCFVNGLMPLRAGRAGFLWTVNFARP